MRGGRCEGSGGRAQPRGARGERGRSTLLLSGQVVYRVPLRESRVLKRSVDQHLRIKIIYDRSVEG